VALAVGNISLPVVSSVPLAAGAFQGRQRVALHRHQGFGGFGSGVHVLSRIETLGNTFTSTFNRRHRFLDRRGVHHGYGDQFLEVITCVTSKECLRRLPSGWHSGSLHGDSPAQYAALNRDCDLRWPGGARFALAGLASILGGIIGSVIGRWLYQE
jgi:hypothetical protein